MACTGLRLGKVWPRCDQQPCRHGAVPQLRKVPELPFRQSCPWPRGAPCPSLPHRALARPAAEQRMGGLTDGRRALEAAFLCLARCFRPSPGVGAGRLPAWGCDEQNCCEFHSTGHVGPLPCSQAGLSGAAESQREILLRNRQSPSTWPYRLTSPPATSEGSVVLSPW